MSTVLPEAPPIAFEPDPSAGARIASGLARLTLYPFIVHDSTDTLPVVTTALLVRQDGEWQGITGNVRLADDETLADAAVRLLKRETKLGVVANDIHSLPPASEAGSVLSDSGSKLQHELAVLLKPGAMRNIGLSKRRTVVVCGSHEQLLRRLKDNPQCLDRLLAAFALVAELDQPKALK